MTRAFLIFKMNANNNCWYYEKGNQILKQKGKNCNTQMVGEYIEKSGFNIKDEINECLRKGWVDMVIQSQYTTLNTA